MSSAPSPVPPSSSPVSNSSSPASGATPSAPAPDRLRPRPVEGYAGDVTPELAWQWVQSGEAVIVDVRSDAEREWVGFVPGAAAVPWKQWPGMAENPAFNDALKAAVPDGKKVVMLCRSGARSINTAKRATELGMEAYNILEGFEGDRDEQGHRGEKGGWRMRGLPWRQN